MDQREIEVAHADCAPDDPRGGNVKATRQDWLDAAMALLVQGGASEVKVLSIGARLGVSRSSFYWYFKDREDLLGQLLREWERTNTDVLRHHCAMPARTITEAVCNLFRSFVGKDQFNYRLDFAVREWARRDSSIRRVIDRADTARTKAIAEMFERHGYDAAEADIRARVLYYQQVGYYTLDLAEPLEARLARVAGYLHAFTGVHADPAEVAAFCAYARSQPEE
jgi:AcrR family transcriptional regulator